MSHRKELVGAIVITIIVSLIVAGTTEGVRQYLQFAWEVEEGDSFVYEAVVIGYNKQGSTYIPLSQAVLNNTRLRIEILSLPNITLFINSEAFTENVIEYLKTNITYDDGEPIPLSLYFTINTFVSRCFLPKGNWRILDSFYPDNIDQPVNETVKAYISNQIHDSFHIGYVEYYETQASGWYGEISKETGIPLSMTLWAWGIVETYEYSYNTTLTLTS